MNCRVEVTEGVSSFSPWILKCISSSVMKRTVCLAQKFRDVFSYPAQDVAHFYPGHMDRGMSRMQRTLKNVDLIVEVHDARIPFSGRNVNFASTLTVRPHLLVLNKMDLADERYFQRVQRVMQEQHGIQNFMYANCKKDRHVSVKQNLLRTMTKILVGEPRYHRQGLDEFNVLVIGVPNVGKSSLINALRRTHMKKRKAVPVGPHAGVTTSVMERVKICESPRIYLYDSPGITTPEVPDMEIAMKLALCATLKDHIIGEDIIADYMLFWLNQHQHFRYVDYFGLPGPTDNILELLAHIAQQHNVIERKRTHFGYVTKPNFGHTAKLALRAFRDGSLGKYNLDEDVFRQTDDT